MKIKQVITFVIVSIVLISCGNSIDYKELYNKELEQYRIDSVDIVQQKFDNLLVLTEKFVNTDSVKGELTHKDINLIIDDEAEDYNAVYLEAGFFMYDDFGLQLGTYIKLMNFKDFIENEPLSFYDDAVPALSYDYWQDFKNECKRFVNTEYYIVLAELESDLPVVEGEEYITGSYTGLVGIYDMNSNELADNFMFTAVNSDEINYMEDENIEKELIRDLYRNISDEITRIMKIRYSTNDDFYVPILFKI